MPGILAYHKKVKNEKAINVLVRKKTKMCHDLYLRSNDFFHSSYGSITKISARCTLWCISKDLCNLCLSTT